MIRTPEVLQREHQVPEHAGRPRAISRYWFAYRGPKQSELLSTVISMTVAGVLYEHRQKRRYSTPTTQDELAAMCGFGRANGKFKSRSTFTRRLSMFRPRNEEDLALESSGRRKGTRTPKAQLLDRARRFAEPNMYSLRIPEGPQDAADPEAYIAPTLADILENPEFSPFFEAPADMKRGGKNSFKKIPKWLWHRRTPLSCNARLVMTYYFMCGLADRHRDTGEVVYEVHPKQSTVAAACGISVRSVYAANCELEQAKLIRVVQQKPRIEGGRIRRGPAKILYLPMRTLTHQECLDEAQRLLKAKDALRDPSWWEKAVGIHTALLRAWTGQEHCMSALHNEFRRQLREAGAPRQVIQDLLPRPPD